MESPCSVTADPIPRSHAIHNRPSVLHSKGLLIVPPELGFPDSASSCPLPLKDRKSNYVKNIFVGNLDFAATDSSVRSIFEQYGQVDRVNIVTDRDTGRSRGFAFVEMTNADEADRAIASTNGMDLDGRALNVNEARPKPQGGGGFGGNRGNGGGYGGNRGNGGNGGGYGNRQRREPRW